MYDLRDGESFGHPLTFKTCREEIRKSTNPFFHAPCSVVLGFIYAVSIRGMADCPFPQPTGVISALPDVPGRGVQQRLAEDCRLSNALHVPGDLAIPTLCISADDEFANRSRIIDCLEGFFLSTRWSYSRPPLRGRSVKLSVSG